MEKELKLPIIISAEKIRENYPKVNIISHTDLDGYGSAAIMLRLCTNLFGYSMDDITVHHIGYSTEYPLIDGFNIITDLSIDRSQTVNREKLIEYSHRKGSGVWWIDHHQSSSDLLETDDKLRRVPHIVDTRRSATYICWKCYEFIYEHKCIYDGDFMSDFENHEFVGIPLMIPDRYPSLFEGVFSHGKKLVTDDPYVGVPKVVRLTDDFDTFELKLGDISIEYNIAFTSSSVFPKDVKHPYYSAFIEPPYKIREILLSGYALEKTCRNQDVATSNLIQVGANIRSLKSWLFLNELNEHGYQIKILPIGSVMREDPIYGELTNIDFVTVNRRDTNPQIVAPEFMKKNPWMLTYVTEYEKVRYTVYCEDLENYHLTAKHVAELLGGGGHPGCAGFITKSLIEEQVKFPTNEFHYGVDYVIVSQPLTDDQRKQIEQEMDAHTQRAMYSRDNVIVGRPIIPECVEQVWWRTNEDLRESFVYPDASSSGD